MAGTLRDIVFPSGDVTQPWSWWYQYGPVTIFQQQSSDPAKEADIIHGVASYGKQLGRIVEALSVIVEQTNRVELCQRDRDALDDFMDMARRIAAAKAGYAAPVSTQLQGMIAAIRAWKEHHKEFYNAARKELMDELNE